MNEIFDPERIGSFFNDPAERREAALRENRATNYGVVRLELLEHIYEQMYLQNVDEPDKSKWQHQIWSDRSIVGGSDNGETVELRLRKRQSPNSKDRDFGDDTLTCDAVVVAAGYDRNAYERLLAPMEDLRAQEGSQSQAWSVRRDYSVELDDEKVHESCGIFLSGCNESTHGVSAFTCRTLFRRRALRSSPRD